MAFILLALIVLACVFPRLALAFIVIGVGVCLVFIFAFQKEQRDIAEARSLVSPDQIELTDVTYERDKIKGRLGNNSPYEVRTDFDCSERAFYRAEAQTGSDSLLDNTVILLDDVVPIRRWPAVTAVAQSAVTVG